MEFPRGLNTKLLGFFFFFCTSFIQVNVWGGKAGEKDGRRCLWELFRCQNKIKYSNKSQARAWALRPCFPNPNDSSSLQLQVLPSKDEADSSVHSPAQTTLFPVLSCNRAWSRTISIRAKHLGEQSRAGWGSGAPENQQRVYLEYRVSAGRGRPCLFNHLNSSEMSREIANLFCSF